MTTTEEKESFGKRIYKAFMTPDVMHAVLTGMFATTSMIAGEAILFLNYPALLESMDTIMPHMNNPMIELFAIFAFCVVCFVHFAKLSFRLHRKVKAWEKRDEEEGRA